MALRDGFDLMTQYVDVLKKAIASLPSNTEAGRAQLYAAARGALSRQLQNNASVPQEEKAKQLAAFELAVQSVEASFAAPAPAAPSFEPPSYQPEPEPQAPAPQAYVEPEPEPQPEPEDAQPEPQPTAYSAPPEPPANPQPRLAPYQPEPQPEPEVEPQEDPVPQEPAFKPEPSFTLADEASGKDESDEDVFDSPLMANERDEMARDRKEGERDEPEFPPFRPGLPPKPSSVEAEDDDILLPVGSDGKVRDFGLKSDDRARLSPHGDKEAGVLGGSTLAKGGLGKVWIIIALFVVIAGASATAYFARDTLSNLANLGGGATPQETAETIAGTRDAEPADETVVDRVVTSTPIRVTDPTRPNGLEATPEEEEALDEIADVLEREAEAPIELGPITQETNEEPELSAEEEAELAARELAEQAAQEEIVSQTLPVGDEASAAARGAALYEESPDDPARELAWAGTVDWSLGAEVLPTGQTSPTVIARIQIPGRAMTAELTFRANFDRTFDASHTVDVEFRNRSSESLPTVEDIGAILLKEAEPTRGEPLAAGKAKVTDGYFLFALSNRQAERESNMRLLAERSWFDLPILFNDNRRAIVVFAKGGEGEIAFNNAIETWTALANAARPAQ